MKLVNNFYLPFNPGISVNVHFFKHEFPLENRLFDLKMGISESSIKGNLESLVFILK